MRPSFTWTLWLILAVSAGAFIEALDAHSLATLSSVSEAYALPLPHRIHFSGVVERPHISGSSLVFDVKNNGLITCYFRHPPPLLSVFPGDSFSIRATLVLTPRGRLCVVDSMDYLFAERVERAP